MIGAMPAVAVRHERRRQEKRTKRPSLLYLQSPPSRSPTPSPLQSPPSVPCSEPPPEIYVCGKVSVLHIVVVSLLLAAVLLIVGLVQLKPGADASQHRFLLLGSGAFLLLFGIVLAMVRCCVLPWAIKRRHRRRIRKGVSGLEAGKQPRASLDVVPHDTPQTPGPQTPGPQTPGPQTPGPQTPGPRSNRGSVPNDHHQQTV
ncbi:uncharacterized protein LOC128999208 [Macrosteles quadrilineatus]|uniref:uncharacterized protein LOC128999208 n=1 Tax=Macrosteles quadrilineatus TaxID=74068 RepID=UPI0023E0B739|nr:uncharacterized protein LOC128999208 [Macrosteles quadrilineatus]